MSWPGIDNDNGGGADPESTELIRQIQEKRGALCRVCRRPLCMHQVLASMVLGAGKAPQCLECLAARLEESPVSLVQHLYGYFQRRECYWTAWKWASQQEGVDPESVPVCLLSNPPV